MAVVSTIDSLPVETTWLTPMFCCAANAADRVRRRAALRHDRHAPGGELGHPAGPRGNLVDEVDEAQAVRPDTRHPELAEPAR